MQTIPLGQVINLSDSGDKPIRVQLLRKGEWFHPSAKDKRLVVDDTLLAELADNFNSQIRGPQLPMNMDHDDPLCKDSPSWINKVEIDNGELFGIVEFSDKEVENKVRSKRIRYVSPEISFGWKNPADGKLYNCLKAVAWTNMPYIKNMSPATEVLMSEAIGDKIQNREEISKKAGDYIKLLDEIEKEYKGRVTGIIGSSMLWDVGFHGFKNQLNLIKEVDNSMVVSAIVDLERQIDRQWEYLSKVQTGSPNTQLRTRDWPIIAEEFKGKLYSITRDLLESTYQDGPTNLAEKFDDKEEDSKNFKESDSDDDERNNTGQSPDDDSQVQHEKNDPDAQDPGLPMQCNSCTKLSDGSCPFQGIEVKLAAAGGGNCPQYLSQQAQVDSKFGDDPAANQQDVDAKLSEKNPMEFEELKNRLEAAELKSTQAEAEKAQLQQEIIDLRKSVELSEAHREESLARERRLNNSTFTDAFVKTGKITPAQANIINNVLAVSQGDTVKLSDNTDASVEALLSEFLGALEQQVPLSEVEGSVELSDSKGRPGNAVGTEHEQLLPMAEERAKEIARAKGEPKWQACLSEAIREVSAERASKQVASR